MKSQTLWFKRKLYGWGWTPATWQGWLIVGLYIAYLGWRFLIIDSMFDTDSSKAFRFGFEIIPPTLILLLVCYQTGEPPKWQWGKR